MTATIDRQVSLEEYIATERREGQRYEYHYGKLKLMPGGTIPHSRIYGNIFYTLRKMLNEANVDCEPFTSELKIQLEKGNRFVYPDASVVCGELVASDLIPGALVNPQLIVEVLSDNSLAYDLTTKQRYYFSLPSVKEYLIVSQTAPSVTLIAKQDEPDLFRSSYADGLEATILLPSLGIEIRLEDMYRHVSFPEPAAD